MLTLDLPYFCAWLRGFIDANDGRLPTPTQWDEIVGELNQCARGAAPQAAPNSITNTYPPTGGYWSPPYPPLSPGAIC